MLKEPITLGFGTQSDPSCIIVVYTLELETLKLLQFIPDTDVHTVIFLLLVIVPGIIVNPPIVNVPVLYNGFGLNMFDIDGVPVILPATPLLSLISIIYLLA